MNSLTERSATGDLLKLSAYGMLAQFWTSLSFEDEIWEDDAKNLLLLQKALIEEAQTTLRPYLDDASMKRFNDYCDRFKTRIVFSEDKKAKPSREGLQNVPWVQIPSARLSNLNQTV